MLCEMAHPDRLVALFAPCPTFFFSFLLVLVLELELHALAAIHHALI